MNMEVFVKAWGCKAFRISMYFWGTVCLIAIITAVYAIWQSKTELVIIGFVLAFVSVFVIHGILGVEERHQAEDKSQ